jgi:chromosome segregation protein
VYLAELELHGFKSFAQKTSVKFDAGITAIVGPNGCGKSNIVDSLRWVLGEQRPSLLRSSSMSNVIFNGSSTRKPLGLAEVSVTIHNNKGILPTEYTDVTITRRLYRNGDSEYLLNRTVCRLKDIVELFMDTGMGSNAYSVIELKMVEEILSDKNADRRRLFEEAAGITKYKERRKLTYKKLEETRGDILRVEDLLMEIRKQTRSLQLQAEKAEKAKTLKERLDKVELGLAYHEYEDLKTQLAPQLAKIAEAERTKEELSILLEQGEHGLKEARTGLAYIEIDRDKKAGELQRMMNLLREQETTLRITLERIQNEDRTIRQYEQDITQADAEILAIKRRILNAEEALIDAEQETDETRFAKTEAEKQFEERRAQAAALNQVIRSLAEKQQAAAAEMAAVQSKRIKIESRLESVGADLKRIGQLQQSADGELSSLRVQLSENDVQLRRHEQLMMEAEETLERQRDQKDILARKQNELKDQLRSLQSRIDAVESEIALLNTIAASHESFPAAVQFLLTKRSEFKLLEPVSEVLSTTETFALALDAALGPVANFVIVQDVADAEHGMELLKSAKKGKVTFIPLNAVPADAQVRGGSLAAHVRCSARFETLKNYLLGQIVVCADLPEARRHANAPGKVAVTVGGEVVTGSVFFRGGSSAQGEGMRLALKDRSEKLEEEALSLEDRIADTQGALSETDRLFQSINLQELTAKFRDSERKFEEIRRNRGVLQTRLNLLETGFSDQQKREQTLRSEQETLEIQQLELEPSLEALKITFDAVIREQSEKRSEFDRMEENRNRAQQQYNETVARWQQTLSVLDNLKKDIERGNETIAGIKSRVNTRSEMAHGSRDAIVELRQQVAALNEEILIQKEKNGFAAEDLAEADATVQRERQKIERIENELQTARRNRDKALEQFHYLQTVKNQMDIKMTAIADFVWESHGLLTDQISQRLDEGQTAEQARSEVSRLKAQLRELGEVNPLAVEEYRTEKERLDFMEGQINDLKSAEGKLVETILEINQTAEQRFNDTFSQIRTNFQEVFKTLFEENDECDLLIEKDPEDPLESRIEILAKPRGKRPSTIMQLSGGEKTLTAIALLFAIYLVKPSPFCILDEVDAPLDDANIERFARILKRFSDETQFIVITHNKKTMEKAQMMYGVTMPEAGVSKLVGVRIGEF